MLNREADKPEAVVVEVANSRIDKAALTLALAIACSHPKPLPPTPHRWLTDNVGLLNPKTVKRLDSALEAYEKRSKHQVFVWIGDSTKGEPYQDFTFRVFNAWGIGRENYDDGVVLWLFARDDMRWITVGYGLEAAIPDREAVRICREVMRPHIQKGRYDEAVDAGVGAIIKAIDSWEKR